MNLFCFSLEGSMDSLYEAVQDADEGQVYTIPSRSCSPAVMLDENTKWRGSERSVSMELSQISTTNSKKKKRKPLIPKSMSDNEALDNAECTNAYWPSSKKREDLVHIKNNQNEGLGLELLQAGFQMVDSGPRLLNNQREREHQVMTYDTWIPNWDRPNSRQQDPIVDTDGADLKGTMKRVQKSSRGKKGNQTAPEEGRNTFRSSVSPCPVHPGNGMFVDDAALGSCMGLPKKAEKRPNTPQRAQENSAPIPSPAPIPSDRAWVTGAPPNRQRWSTSGEPPPPWDGPYHTCRRPLSEFRTYTCDFTLPRPEGTTRQHSPHCVSRSTTGTDFSVSSTRSTSFGRFDAFRHPSPAKLEENGVPPPADGDVGADGDQSKPGGLGKKMRAISMTMRKRMGKKYSKASFYDEAGEDDTDRDHEGEGEGGHSLEKESANNSNSQESLCSGQSSSSGVTSGSDGSNNRDSLRLEEDVPYTGQFCGRARVHTDFVPSPYDSDSLKLKVGDVIDIISKPPMGIWTGMLNNKVGNFKFIYVDILVEEQPEAPKIRPHRRSKRPRPKTLQELLERLNLEEYASSLLLNGYQTVEDLRDLKEKDLIELNVLNLEHRQQLLAAAECLQDGDNDNEKDKEVTEEPKSRSGSLRPDQNDCPRDSGCYVSSESTDNSKEDIESQPESPST